MSDKRIPPMRVFKDGDHWRIADADAMRKVVAEHGYSEWLHVGHSDVDYQGEVALEIAIRIGIKRTREASAKMMELSKLLAKQSFTVVRDVPDVFGILVVDSELLRTYEDCYSDLDGFIHGSL